MRPLVCVCSVAGIPLVVHDVLSPQCPSFFRFSLSCFYWFSFHVLFLLLVRFACLSIHHNIHHLCLVRIRVHVMDPARSLLGLLGPRMSCASIRCSIDELPVIFTSRTNSRSGVCFWLSIFLWGPGTCIYLHELLSGLQRRATMQCQSSSKDVLDKTTEFRTNQMPTDTSKNR